MKKVLFLFFFLVLQLHAEDEVEQVPLVPQVLSLQLTVGDMDRSVGFYTSLLKFEKVSDTQINQGKAYDRLTDLENVKVRVVQLQLGDEYLVLKQFLNPKGKVIPSDFKNNEPWYDHIVIVVSDMAKAYRLVSSQHSPSISTYPQTYPPSFEKIAGITDYYFKDPDGHPLALIHYPPNKGARKWHRSTNQIFLGIDHTAIVVKDTKRSLDFYQKLLGFKVTRVVLKQGKIQENLTFILGARVSSTMLRSEEGPGIELMEYLHPPPEKILKDTKVNDIWYEQINTVSEDVDKIYEKLKNLHDVKIISKGIQDFHWKDFRAFIAQDPDGHAILFSQRELLPDERTYFRKQPASL